MDVLWPLVGREVGSAKRRTECVARQLHCGLRLSHDGFARVATTSAICAESVKT